MLKVSSHTKVYIVCPHNFTTGGVESLHQLSFKLQASGIPACMVYYPFTATPIVPHQFTKYNPVPDPRIEDEEQNILIIPEVFIDYSLDNFKKIRKVIWWLSVANYESQKLIRDPPDLDFIKTRNIYNLVQSAHAKAFLHEHEVNVDGYLSGYINSSFREEHKEEVLREEKVLYNPKKGNEYTSRLMEAAPELNWVALINMTPAQVKKTLLSGKVYIDFGHHPGRERFPREAALSKCCIITGRRGSAAYFEDLPIPGEFKFDEATSAISDVIKTIKKCLTEYETQIAHFQPFCALVNKEEERLELDLKTIFTYS